MTVDTADTDNFRPQQNDSQLTVLAKDLTTVIGFDDTQTVTVFNLSVKGTIEAIAQRHAGSRVIALLEPRTNTSRRKLFQDDYVDALPAHL